MWNDSKRPSARPPAIPRLEQLEDRTLLSSPGSVGSGTGPVVQPPTQFQASVSLAVDGAYLVSFNLLMQYITNSGTNPGALDEFGFVPSITADATARAAAAGISLNALMSVNAFLGSILSSEGVNIPGGALNDIQLNLPYAGPFAPFALMAGAQAALQAVQQPATH